ncbi:MAG TPA: hypothetical protein VK968_14060, partial [Roseimicrobium sp.]|nr:hypothetical protein [Roseimicrobium sp.]
MVEGLESRTLLTGTYYVPLTIAHDYSADVTEDLEAFFATVDAGSTIVFPDLDYDADTVGYNIEGTLSILNMEDVVIEGNGAFLRAFDYDPPDPRNRRHVSIGDTNDGVTMQNFTIIGADPTPGTFSAPREAQHGLSLGGSNILIDNVDIFSVAGDFVYFGAGASNVTVQNSYFDGAGRQGVAPCNGHDILIQNNYINNVGRHLIDF